MDKVLLIIQVAVLVIEFLSLLLEVYKTFHSTEKDRTPRQG